MKLYYEPSATTCRPIMLFAAEHQIALDFVHVNLFCGEHRGEDYAALNPNKAVPMLEDGAFRLTESSAILEYLADVVDSPAYPKALRDRARVNAAMDWFHTNFYQDLGYGVVYPQVLPDYSYPEIAAARLTAWSLERAEFRLGVLDARLAEAGFVCGEEISLADYQGSAYATLPELVAFDFGPWPNVRRWIADMKARPAWDEVNAAFYGWRSAALVERREARLTA